jgi:hypothetical protein
MVETNIAAPNDTSPTLGLVDFAALVGHLNTRLMAAGVSDADRNAILGALAPMCADIVNPAEVASCNSL